MTEMSSNISYEHSNPSNNKNRASRSAVNASLTSSSTTSSSAQKNYSSCPQGSNYEKKQKEKENYLACLSSIWDDYATEMVAKRALTRKLRASFLTISLKERRPSLASLVISPRESSKPEFDVNVMIPSTPEFYLHLMKPMKHWCLLASRLGQFDSHYLWEKESSWWTLWSMAHISSRKW